MNKKANQRVNSEQVQMTLGIFLIILVLGFLIFFIIKQNIDRIKVLKTEVTNSQAGLSSLENKLASLDQAQTSFEKISDKIEIIDEAIPNYSNVTEVMKILEKLATEIVDEGGPLIINSISVPKMPNDIEGAAKESDELLQSQEVSLIISMSGDYQAVRDYIIKLKKLRHNFYLEKITFSAPQESKGSFLSVTLNIKYYFFTKEQL